jgi:hypothetical protein
LDEVLLLSSHEVGDYLDSIGNLFTVLILAYKNQVFNHRVNMQSLWFSWSLAGAALMGTFITSVAGVAFYEYLSLLHTDMAVAPDWILGILFGFGGLLGMYLGARTQKFVPARIIKSILCACVIFVAFRYIMEFFNYF